MNAASTNPVKVGNRAIAVTANPWSSVVFHIRAALPISGATKLEFWIHGGPSGGQSLDVELFDNSSFRGAVPIAPLVGGAIPANTWSKVTVDLSSLGITAGQLTDVHVSNNSGTVATTFSLDDVRLTR